MSARLGYRTYGLDSGEERDWRTDAACRGHDPSMWELQPGTHTDAYRAAHRICRGCPVKAQCLDWAEQTGSWGFIFGGEDFPKARRRRSYLAPEAVPRECPGCLRSFTTNSSRQRYCTKRCRWAADRRRAA